MRWFCSLPRVTWKAFNIVIRMCVWVVFWFLSLYWKWVYHLLLILASCLVLKRNQSSSRKKHRRGFWFWGMGTKRAGIFGVLFERCLQGQYVKRTNIESKRLMTFFFFKDQEVNELKTWSIKFWRIHMKY